jgi:hypothetical protein
MYPQLQLPVPDTDVPVPRPQLGEGADRDAHVVRWGDATTATFEHGEAFFKDAEEVFAFSPLAKGDFTDWPHVVKNHDYRDEERLYRLFMDGIPEEWRRTPLPPNGTRGADHYNTMFMWPLLTFGWELFLECCLDERFERIMDEFAEMNRRFFRVLARLPINFVICHDDIATSRGPVCSPDWMRKYIYPRYEEFFGILRAGGKRVIFMVDGCVDAMIDDVIACGAQGCVSEPFTDYRAIAKRHKNICLAGEGDNRILCANDPEPVDAMVRRMVETSKHGDGYCMCIGNHIPWNVPAEAIRRYLGRSEEWGLR